jgi:hypothetical protein
MLDASGRGEPTAGGNERESRFSQGTVLRLKIESAVMQEIHLHESHRSLAASTLRSELRSLCADAKRMDMHAEQLVVVIEEVWNSIPAARAHARPADAQSLLSRVVTMVLGEYYPKPPLQA